MHFHFLSLGLLALQASAGAVLPDRRNQEVARTGNSLNQHEAGGLDSTVIPLVYENVQKRGRKKPPKPPVGGGSGGTRPSPSPEKNQPSPSPIKDVPSPSPVASKPSPSPINNVPSPSPVASKPSPSASKSQSPVLSSTQSMSKASSQTTSASSSQSATGTDDYTPVPPWPTKYAVGTCKGKKQPTDRPPRERPLRPDPDQSAAKSPPKPVSKRNTIRSVIEKRNEKELTLKSLKLKFPNYPGAGDVIRSQKKYKGVAAYGANDPVPCNRDYTFKKLPSPKKQPDGLEANDLWNTEHVLDAQVVKAFFQSILEDATLAAKLPLNMATANGPVANPSMEQWINEFWIQRKDPLANDESAMSTLLKVYPGTAAHYNELTLLGGKINKKKGNIFAPNPEKYTCIASNWASLDWDEKIADLKHCVHLSQYLSVAQIHTDMKAVADRIKDEFDEIEGPNGFISQRHNAHPNTPDQAGEMYQDQSLSTAWSAFVKSHVKKVIDKLDKDIKKKILELQKEKNDAKDLCDRSEALYQKTLKRYKEEKAKTPRDQTKFSLWKDRLKKTAARANDHDDKYEEMREDFRALRKGWSATSQPTF